MVCTLERPRNDLSRRFSLCGKNISITEEKEISRKTNRYAESMIENITQRFPNKSITVLNAFEILNLELLPTSLSPNQSKCFGLNEIKS